MSYTKYNVIGSVILYNSKIQVISNIQSYINQINHLIVIDNSETPNLDMIECFKKYSNITYISNGSNQGVAYALNQAANVAIKYGYQFMLTMDDDTQFPENGIQKMLNYINSFGLKKLGIVASQSDYKLFNNTVNKVTYTITSGNLLNLSAYVECGPFLNDLFIDFVDHEFCFRLNEHGYEIIELNYIHLNHNLGQSKQVRLLNYETPIYWISHSPLRIYYKTRNCIFSLSKHNSVDYKVKYTFYKVILKDFLKIIFLEDKKNLRISLFLEGLYDGLIKKLGKKLIKN